MKTLFNKNIAVYIFSGLFICFLASIGFVYSQLKDLDDLKITVVKKIEKLTGRNVSIEGAELKLEKGISIRLQKLSIDSLNGESREFLAKSAWCVVKLWPLLQKKIEIKKFIIEGISLELVRDKQGKFNFTNPFHLLNDSAQSGLFKVLGASFMHQLSVSDSEVKFLDYYNISGTDPFSILVNNISITINKRFFRNAFSFNLTGEIPNDYQPAMFKVSGGMENLENTKTSPSIPVKGKIQVNRINIAQLKPYLKNIFSAIPNDMLLSLESGFSGVWGTSLRSEGQLSYFKSSVEKRPTRRNLGSSNKGEIDYSFLLNNDSLEIEDLKIRSSANNFSGSGNLIGFKSKNPVVSFAIQASEFKIGETRNIFPLMIFPEPFHKKINQHIDNGTLEVKSLQYDGSLKQLTNLDLNENKNRITAEIGFKKVNWHSPLPPLEKVTGFFKYKNGDGFIEIVKAKFDGMPVANLKGIVKGVMNNPLADLSIESELDLGKLNHALKKSIAGQSFEKILDDYQEVEGKGLLEAKLQGPLEELEKVSVTAIISTKKASFYDAYLQSRVRNFSGQIHFNYVPVENQSLAKPSVPIVEGKNLSGEFGKSEFYNMQGKILRQGENIVQKMEAVYRLNAAELPKIIDDIDFGGPELTLFKQAQFEQGDVEVRYRSFMDLDQPKEKESWGKINLKDIKIKHPFEFQPLIKLVGEVSFGDGRIDINKIEGWYGDSQISIYGKLTPKLKSIVDFDLHATLSDWTQADFKNIPYFENLKFAGSINPQINLVGNRHSFIFKNKLDLTKASYKFQDAIHKKENNPNKFEMEGIYSEKEGINIDRFKFILDKSSFTGKGNIKNLADPEYLIEIHGVGFPANTLASLMDAFGNNTGGKIDFNILGQGNLNQPGDSMFKGSAVLKDLVFEWKDRENPLTLSADVRFSGDTFNLRSGSMASGLSQVSFRGRYKNKEKPELILKLTGETLVVDQFLSNKKKDEDKAETNLKDLFEQSHLLSNGKSKISVNLKQLDYKWITLRDVSGILLLKDREIIFNRFRVGSKNSIKGRGKLSVKDPESIRFQTKLQANEIEAADFLAMFGGHFKGGLTGKFKELKLSATSRGRKLSENIRTLNGKLSFGLANGVIDTKKLKAGAFDLFGLEVPIENKIKTEIDEGPKDFEDISGDFIYIGGIAETENFIYETDQRKSAIVGKFDLNKLEMDTVVGVAHMPGLDKLLTQIPVVGKLLTAGDEGSLIKSYYDVSGPFDNPSVTLVPLTSLGKQFMGIFQGILQTSEEILNIPEKVGTQVTD